MNYFWNRRIKDTEKKDGSEKRASFPTVLFIFVIAAALFTVGNAGKALAAVLKAEGDTSVVMDVTYGYGDEAKGDRYLPLRVTLENKEEEDFSGTLEFFTTASSREPYRYEYSAAIAGSGKSEELYYIPLGVRGDQLFVTLRGKDGNEVLKKRIKLNISGDVSEVFIGVLSDQPDSLLYFDEVGIRFGSLKTKVISLNRDLIPEDPRGFDQLDILIIADYDLERLSGEQQTAMMDWVGSGGTLLFGGGARYGENMGNLAGELLENPGSLPSLREVNLGAEYSQNAPEDAVLELVSADLSLKKGSILLSGDEFPLLSYTHRKDGRIVVAAFALQDLEEFCEGHPAFTEKLLLLTLGDANTEKLSQMDYYGFSGLYFSIQGLINTGNVDRLPRVALYTVLMILYVFLIGPGLYLILKKKALQRYYIWSVAVCSLVFTAAIYIVGAKTRYREPFFTYATVLDLTDEKTTEETFINVRSPFNKPYTVALKPEYKVRPVTKSYYYDSFSTPEFTGAEDYNTAVVRKADRTELKIRDSAAFTPKMFSLERELAGTGKSGIESSIRFFGGKVTGSVKNASDLRLESAALLLYGRAILLGDMEPGQEISLNEETALYYPLNYTYALTQAVTGADRYEKADISDGVYMLAQERTRLLSFYMDNTMSEYTPEARLVAFSPGKNEKIFLAGEDYITEGITLITASVNVTMEQEGQIYRSALEQAPNVISGSYESEYNSMYTGEPAEPVVLEYSLGNDLKLETLTFEALSSEFKDNPRYPYVTAFQGKMYFYNYNTGRNDLMEEGKTEFAAWELEPYLSPSNTITVKYVSEGTSQYGWDKLLPMIYATGREK